ncbi:hypothetical protein [Synechococcus sp. PROS-U-1]|uniref:hypothetical protein n=1 Tax=Synechococcus sp. PROS-U-1 TaxID=1400866 RepID=UPI00164456DA|nr:hypothetical protein [Synechococcus sp. PROS-U-1]QNJ04273.1 hypothetical protein SynPROSU1_02682 [Synechococcus sp. PROS-U-1]
MPRKASNVFSKIINVIGAFDDLNLVDNSDTLIGNFRARSRTNKKGISNVKAVFTFKDDAVSGLGFKKVIFKDKITNSFFGDAENARTVKSGNKKFDYLDKGKKIVELSIEPEFINEFENGKKLKGFFRASLEDNFIAMSTGQKEQFQDNKFLTADFEEPLI